MRKSVIILLSLLVLSINSFARLSGNIEGVGLWNFDKGHKEDAQLKLQLDTTKLRLVFNLSGGHRYNPTQENKTIIDVKKQSAYRKDEKKDLFKRNWYVTTGFLMNWKLTSQDVLDIGLQYGYNGNKDRPLLTTDRYAISEDTLFGIQKDTTSTIEHLFKPQLTYTHTFAKADSKVHVGLIGLINRAKEDLLRRTDGNIYSTKRRYKTHNSKDDIDTRIEAFYQDGSLGGINNLTLQTGFDFIWHTDIDIYNGSNYVAGTWRDSVGLNRSHLYYSFALEPNIVLTYSYKGLELMINERLQWYHHQLSNRIDEKAADEYMFRKSQWQNILMFNIGYKFNSRHRLDLAYNHTLERPDYDKLNPAITIGKNEGEYIKGNPDLKPTTQDEVGLTYGFMAEHFGVDLALGYRYTKDKAEKVIEVATSDSTIFTWLNSKKQHTEGVTLDLIVDYEAVDAKMWVGTFYDTYIKNDKVDKTDLNFEVGMSISAALTPSVHLSSDLIYRSAKVSTYNAKGEYIGANFQLTKTFTIPKSNIRKESSKLDLYVKVSDLVDKPDYEQTWNKELTYYKETEKILNRRSVSIGINYKF